MLADEIDLILGLTPYIERTGLSRDVASRIAHTLRVEERGELLAGLQKLEEKRGRIDSPIEAWKEEQSIGNLNCIDALENEMRESGGDPL